MHALEPDERGYYRHPTIFADQLVFVCQDDLWTVATSGGTARRLTVSLGSASFPTLSRDGRLIAFTSSDDGPSEAYVIPADGGPTRRLTFFGCGTQVVCWRPDGRSVIVATSYQQPFPRVFHLFEVAVSDGQWRQLPVGPARALAYEPGGPGVVLGRNSGDPARWKRYRGGTAGTIWIDPNGDSQFRRLIDLPGNLANPMWIGQRIYFLSDHETFGNLYSCSPAGDDLKRHTEHEDYYVRFPATDGTRIAYHAGADLFVHDVESNTNHPVDVRIRSARSERQRRFVDAERFLESYELHPEGHSLVMVCRGGAFSMGLWEGPARRHGVTSSIRYRLAQQVPKGSHIVAVSDDGAGESLVLLPDAGGGEGKRIAGDFGRAIDLEVDPTGKRVALTNERLELIMIELKNGHKKEIDRSEYDRIDGLAWSPDGRYLAYGFRLSRRTSCIKVLDRRSGTLHNVTGTDFRDVRPSFDPDGKYLYFLSWRVFDPVHDNHYFDLGFPRGMRPYLVTLCKDDPSPFDVASRKPRPPSGEDPDDDADSKGDKPVKLAIDWDGIEQRVVAFPVEEGVYGRVCGLKGGQVVYSCFPVIGSLDNDPFDDDEDDDDDDGELELWDFNRHRSDIVIDRVTDFAVAPSAATIAVRSGRRLRVVHASSRAERRPEREEPGRDSGWIDLDRMRVAVNPPDEWRQMFNEAWCLQRDHFWAKDMSGVDWQAVRARYLPLVDRVTSRSEFSDLLWELQGELGTSHCYELGGDYRMQPEWHQGFLGVDLELERRGTWRVARIPRGDSWDPRARSPLAAPGLGIEVGDVIASIDGQPIDATAAPGERLVNLAGEEVELTVIARGGKRKRRAKSTPRVVAVTTLVEEHTLRYRDWVETNRAYVHTSSRGRVGYVHIPNMGPQGYAEFHRYYMLEVDRDGLMVDVRWNGGGNVSQLLLEKLIRRPIGYDLPRWGKPDSYPADAPRGPMVALINEHAGSDGDIFSHCFKHYRLGPLIGKRTWGGVIGIWPRHSLVDGTITTQAEFASWFEGVGWGLENHGVDPDIEVDNEPHDYAIGRDAQLERGLEEIARLLEVSPPRPLALGDYPRRAPTPLPKPAATGRRKGGKPRES